MCVCVCVCVCVCLRERERERERGGEGMRGRAHVSLLFVKVNAHGELPAGRVFPVHLDELRWKL